MKALSERRAEMMSMLSTAKPTATKKPQIKPEIMENTKRSMQVLTTYAKKLAKKAGA